MTNETLLEIGDIILCPTCDKPKKVIDFERTICEDFHNIKFECGHSLLIWSKLVRHIWEGTNPKLKDLTIMMRDYVKNKHPVWRMAEGSFKSDKQYYKWKIERITKKEFDAIAYA